VYDASRGPAQARDPTILIAEDHADSRDALRALLEASGYRVDLAANGEEALRRAAERAPDLILMDIMMPVLDGLEATRRLRGNERFDSIPIVALTANDGARDTALAAGCDECLIKPIDVPSFLALVHRHVNRGR
jgi:CheY-like chemotaxis protein